MRSTVQAILIRLGIGVGIVVTVLIVSLIMEEDHGQAEIPESGRKRAGRSGYRAFQYHYQKNEGIPVAGYPLQYYRKSAAQEIVDEHWLSSVVKIINYKDSGEYHNPSQNRLPRNSFAEKQIAEKCHKKRVRNFNQCCHSGIFTRDGCADQKFSHKKSHYTAGLVQQKLF